MKIFFMGRFWSRRMGGYVDVHYEDRTLVIYRGLVLLYRETDVAFNEAFTRPVYIEGLIVPPITQEAC